MKMNNEQEQMIKEEFCKKYKCSEMERAFDPCLNPEWNGYLQGRLKSIEEIEKIEWQRSLTIKANDNQIVMIETLESKLQEKEQEIEMLNDIINNMPTLVRCITCNRFTKKDHGESFTSAEIIGGEVVERDDWECNHCYEKEELESKLPDQDKLKEALECLTLLDNILIYTAKEDDFMHKIDYLKTFLESLGEK